MTRTVRLDGEVTGISMSGDVDDITVRVHPAGLPVATSAMTFQLPHEDDVSDLYRTRMLMYVVFDVDEGTVGEALVDQGGRG